MKRTCAFVLCAGLISGCGSNDSKIEALSQKLDGVLANQAAISNQLAAIKTQVDALPTADAVNRIDYFYHTNMMTAIWNQNTNTLAAIGFIYSIENGNLAIFTNISERQSETLLAIQGMKPTITPLTVGDPGLIQMEAQVGALSEQCLDIGRQLIQIKARLGIPY